MPQPGVTNLGVDEIQRSQVGQPFEMLQPGVSNFGIVEVQVDYRVYPETFVGFFSVTLTFGN